ncbi:polysaccharide biosynthesis/export family protein [Leisingera sp. XS_AS12]|uniref:polysaccharide biosynthesis/export family protein n=1 Tax=Leisingera sp. XS_AS12 TaxID=3241294 RepID=UPI0035118760
MTKTFHAQHSVSIALLRAQRKVLEFLPLVCPVYVRPLILLLAAALSAAAVPTSAQNSTTGDVQAYVLGPADQISIRVVAWDDSKMAFAQFDELGGNYTIGIDGTMMMPLVGSIRAAGQTGASLAAAVSAAVQQKTGLSQPPSTTVNILKYRPVYVLGDVMRPGSYDFRPGLTTVQAVALAGGLYRLNGEETGDLIAAIRTSGTYREVGLTRARMQLRAARLQAEQADQDSLLRPEGLSSPGGEAALAAMFEQEKILFASRRETLANALAELDTSRKLLESEIAARQEKLTALERQIGLVRESVGTLDTLLKRGLSRSQSLVVAQQTLIELEARALDNETGIFKAQQQISELDRSKADLISTRRLQVLRELQATEAEIDRLSNREVVNRRILRESGAGAMLAGETPDKPVSIVRYQILRSNSGEPAAQPAGRATVLQPLDVLEVILEDPLEAASSSEGG